MMPPMLRRRRPRGASPKRSSEKGRELVRYVKAILEARGWRLEEAQNVIRWWPADECPRCNLSSSARRCARCGTAKPLAPHSVHHDFFGCWDLLAVEPGDRSIRHFYQVTTRTNLAHRRAKIMAEGPWTCLDAIVAYRSGRGRHFEVFFGPDFTRLNGERWELVKQHRKSKQSLGAPIAPAG